MRPQHALEIAHHHPGRLRLRSRAFALEGDGVSRARSALEAIGGVTNVTEDERTGSLLVHYDAVRVEADELVGAVANATGLNVKPRRRVPPSEREYIALRVIEATKKLDDLTFEVTGGRVGLGMVVPATLAGMSAFAFVVDKKRRMPRWDNLLYWSYTIFTALHEPEIEAVRKGTERQ